MSMLNIHKIGSTAKRAPGIRARVLQVACIALTTSVVVLCGCAAFHENCYLCIDDNPCSFFYGGKPSIVSDYPAGYNYENDYAWEVFKRKTYNVLGYYYLAESYTNCMARNKSNPRLVEFARAADSDGNHVISPLEAARCPYVGNIEAVVNKNGVVRVVRRYGAAWKYGLKAGDRILEIDDQAVLPGEADAYISRLVGPPLSLVTLKVARKNKERTIIIIRSRGQMGSVTARTGKWSPSGECWQAEAEARAGLRQSGAPGLATSPQPGNPNR